ncbi:hypothetical protein PYW07_009604 [Mythimna separata]|uniref:Uncharacterized protein n=1 Tax=Mythimna separata TaxID=271217 RepID=A0AAD8DMF3_MYTSE|nr:hypothetical protein PYW07_009604 [Mythimna separata]
MLPHKGVEHIRKREHVIIEESSESSDDSITDDKELDLVSQSNKYNYEIDPEGTTPELDSPSSPELFEIDEKKIRKLEEKLKNLPQDSEEETPCRSSSRQYTPPPPPSATETVVMEESININETEAANYTENDQLPEEFLLALGKEGEEKEEFGDPIRPELALRWTKIMSEGLGKDARDKLIEKYPIPSNFPNAVAPVMNAELLATLSEPSVKRDRRIVYRQNLVGNLMTCLGRSLTNILKGDINSKKLIEEINDAAKIASEIHHQDSSSRKFSFVPNE